MSHRHRALLDCSGLCRRLSLALLLLCGLALGAGSSPGAAVQPKHSIAETESRTLGPGIQGELTAPKRARFQGSQPAGDGDVDPDWQGLWGLALPFTSARPSRLLSARPPAISPFLRYQLQSPRAPPLD